MPRKARKREYGSGSVYRRGNTFTIQWRTPDGTKKYESGFTSQEQASEALKMKTSSPGAGPQATGQQLSTLVTAWLKERAFTHASNRDDELRWKKHLEPVFGHLEPDQLDTAKLAAFIKGKRQSDLKPATVGLLVRLLSTIYTSLIEANAATRNPVKSLTKQTKALFKPDSDPKDTPFLTSKEQIRDIYQGIQDNRVQVAFAVGTHAGLRTSEVLGLSWEDIDLPGKRITVRRQFYKGQLRGLKDKEGRTVPILGDLGSILESFQGPEKRSGLLFPDMDQAALWRGLKAAQLKLELPTICWYHATRHTMASHWVMGGGSIEWLAQVMGHSSAMTTRRYAHLRPELLPSSEMAKLGTSFGGLTAELTADMDMKKAAPERAA